MKAWHALLIIGLIYLFRRSSQASSPPPGPPRGLVSEGDGFSATWIPPTGGTSTP